MMMTMRARDGLVTWWAYDEMLGVNCVRQFPILNTSLNCFVPMEIQSEMVLGVSSLDAIDTNRRKYSNLLYLKLVKLKLFTARAINVSNCQTHNNQHTHTLNANCNPVTPGSGGFQINGRNPFLGVRRRVGL